MTSSPDPRSIRDELKAARNRLGLTQVKLAEKLGMKVDTLRYYERGALTTAFTAHAVRYMLERMT